MPRPMTTVARDSEPESDERNRGAESSSAYDEDSMP